MKTVRLWKLTTKLGIFFIVLSLLALNINPVSAQNSTNESLSELGTVSSTISQLQPTDILFNGGFELGDSSPLGWQQDAWNLSNSTFLWDTAKKHSGNKSIEIANSYNNDARWIQTVYVQPNSDYLLSGWIKTQIVAHTPDSVDAGANLSVMGGFD